MIKDKDFFCVCQISFIIYATQNNPPDWNSVKNEKIALESEYTWVLEKTCRDQKLSRDFIGIKQH